MNRHLVLIPAIVAALFIKAPVSLSASEAFSIRLPAPVVQFDDIDMRDEFNRPIKSAAMRQDMRRLFESNLLNLLVNNLTPAARELQSMLGSSWSAWRQVFRRPFATSPRRVSAASSERKEILRPAPSRHVGAVPPPSAEATRFNAPSFRQSQLSLVLDSTRLLR